MTTNTTTTSKPIINRTVNLGNNESASRGVFPQADGSFVALTFATSRTFKTRRGAENWFRRVTK